jgi:hypothetical protein
MSLIAGKVRCVWLLTAEDLLVYAGIALASLSHIVIGRKMDA